MADAYEVITPSLTSHARGLADLSGDLSTALTAADVTVTNDAYGQAGAKLAAALTDVARKGQDTLRAGINALEQAAAAMRATVTAYEQQEKTGQNAFDRIRS